jgi:putative membrane-bound dehydrogenase-like protein
MFTRRDLTLGLDASISQGHSAVKSLPGALVLAASLLCSLAAALPTAAGAQELDLHEFQRLPLTDVYYSEGANFGDFNRDGHQDVVHGPFWFAGPEFKTAREIYPAKPQPRERYADSFFSWPYDFDGDGWLDVFAVGFPGTPAYVYRNPGEKGWDRPWPRHEVFPSVANESPQLLNIVGDERPELVCTFDGFFGYATIDWQKPLAPWTFHRVSEQIAPKQFGHGLGVGDVNGDGRADILCKDGWFEQPAALAGDPRWPFHAVEFARAGGADMHAYDVDGDGDNDVITSLAAHEFGLAWYEQVRQGEQIAFRRHLIMGSKPEENRYGLVFSELHSVALADIDGDGLKDIVTGKTYWSHHRQSPMWDAGAVVYWFKLVRGEGGVDFIPYLADGEAGIGRQVIVGDVNNDRLPDIVVGGMKGAHVLLHARHKAADRQAFQARQPRPRRELLAGLSPQEAAAQMTLPDGFRVTLAAGEPDVHQPVALAIDHRGRLWIAEAYTYPIRAPQSQGKDKLLIFEDTNGDGTLDQRTVFAEGLNLVSGLEVGFGGVFVGAAPYLMFIPDKNADDRPDGPPEILLDGFGYQDTHETLNAFIWGPDGWLYGCHGVFTHSRVGKPGTPDNLRIPINAGIWRYHPTRHTFEVFAWGTSNPWGVDFNDHGQAFCTACVIPHLYHVIQGGRYQRQAGAHFGDYVYDDIKTIADHAHYAGDIREHAWWGHEPQAPAATLAAGGGHAHCGAMIYLGDSWPRAYRNQIFFNNIHGNRVNNDRLVRRGSGYVGQHNPDLLLANDRWFRGINLRYGPDGGVYLIDWYDRNACHRVTPEIWDRTNGRIYKITYQTRELPKHLDLSKLSDPELVELQTHRNDWFVRTARRILQERGGSPAVHAALVKLLETHPSVPVQLRALWALHATGGLTQPLGLKLLNHPEEYLRAWVIQLALEEKPPSPEFLARLGELARSDPSPVVRLYLASALQRIEVDQRWEIASDLLSHAEDAEDHNLPLMYWYGIEPLVPTDPARAMKLADAAKLPRLSQFVVRRAAAQDRTINVVVQTLTQSKDPARQAFLLTEMLRAFEGRVGIPTPPAWKDAYEALTASSDPNVREQADQVAVVLGDRRILPKLRARLVDNNEPLPRRKQALDVLVRGRDTEAAAAFQAVLGEPELRGPALRALAAFDHPDTPRLVLEQYARLSESERRDAVTTLVSRPAYALALLEALQQDRVPRTDLHAYHVQQLLHFNHADLNRRIKEVWGEFRETAADKRQQIAKHKALLSPERLSQADPGNGRRLFAKTCANCHVLFGEGSKVGPDITGSNRANLDYILENLIDPSAVLGKDYRMTVLNTTDGRAISGLVLKETDSALTIRTLNDTIVVAKSEIAERQLSEKSMMPEQLLDPFSPDEVRDLVAYLASPEQVPLRGPKAPIDPDTRRVPGAIEGETMKVLSRSAGNSGSQKMTPFPKDRWSGDDHLWWTGGAPGAVLELELPLAKAGRYELELVLTRARDYGMVQLQLDDRPLGEPIDLYNFPDVVTTGVLSYDVGQLAAGQHKLIVKLTGCHPKAVPAYMFGLDYVRWKELHAE